MSDSNLLIHIGYPKTASTWLQQGIFKEEDMGFSSPWRSDWADPIVIDQFITVDSFSFCPQKTYSAFEKGLKDAKEKGLYSVLSQEMLSCNFLDQSGYWGKEVADRLHSVFPQAKVLIIIREQKSMILSAYGQNIRKGGRQSIEQFISTENFKSGRYPLFRLYVLKYDLLIKYYQELFGENQVLVLPFELLKKDPISYIEHIFNFVGIQNKIINQERFPLLTNANYKSFTLKIHKIINNFFIFPYRGYINSSDSFLWKCLWKFFSLLDKYIPQKLQDQEKLYLDKIVSAYIKNMYIESNQKTSQLIKMDLSKFGYDY